jgi:hypothetical protein
MTAKALLKYDGYPVLHVESSDEDVHGNNNRQLKLALLKDICVCYWCGVECRNHEHKDGVSPPDDAATIDHLVSRFHRKRGEIVPKVLACYKCNNRRCREELRIFPPNPPRKKLSTQTAQPLS